jgi:hypothetical protein
VQHNLLDPTSRRANNEDLFGLKRKKLIMDFANVEELKVF